MDNAVLISAVIMTFIAGAEIFCLFLCSKCRGKRYPITAVIPLLSSDDELEERLEYILSFTERGASPIEHILLVDISASEEQLSFCGAFCESCKIAEIVSCGDFGKKLSETFAIPLKT